MDSDPDDLIEDPYASFHVIDTEQADATAVGFIRREHAVDGHTRVVVTATGPDPDGELGTVLVSAHPDQHPSVTAAAVRAGYGVMATLLENAFGDTWDLDQPFVDDDELVVGDRATWPGQVFSSVVQKLDTLAAANPDVQYLLVVGTNTGMHVTGRGDHEEVIDLAREAIIAMQDSGPYDPDEQ